MGLTMYDSTTTDTIPGDAEAVCLYCPYITGVYSAFGRFTSEHKTVAAATAAPIILPVVLHGAAVLDMDRHYLPSRVVIDGQSGTCYLSQQERGMDSYLRWFEV